MKNVMYTIQTSALDGINVDSAFALAVHATEKAKKQRQPKIGTYLECATHKSKVIGAHTDALAEKMRGLLGIHMDKQGPNAAQPTWTSIRSSIEHDVDYIQLVALAGTVYVKQIYTRHVKSIRYVLLDL